MFMSCRALTPARHLLVTSGQQWLRLTINNQSAKEILKCCDNVNSRCRGDTGLLRHLVVALNKVIWDYRCRIVFEREAFVFDGLKYRFFYACHSIFQRPDRG